MTHELYDDIPNANDTPENAFLAYKEYKEKLIKQIADIEFSKHTISQKCYDAMYNYEIEITD